MKNYKLGIIGGMGPAATNYFLELFFLKSPANFDQGHVSYILYSNPATPDRTAHIMGIGVSPLPFLLEAIHELNFHVLNEIIILCNTSHYYYQDLLKESRNPIVNLIDETVKYVFTLRHKNIGVLATKGTIKTNLYQSMIYDYGMTPVIPDDEITDYLVMDAIYGKHGIKAGGITKPRESLKIAISHLKDKGAETIILGCTELPIVLSGKKTESIELIDPYLVIIDIILKKASI